ncbi:MAG: hypothetical protein VX951_00495 [Planctomycetota bacterium]|nr:hypothetical protein [Planctomycetota bacterium]
MASRRTARKSRQNLDSPAKHGSGEAPSRRRRSASSRRQRGGDDAAGGSSGHRPAIGRDGKASISCPNCSTRYKIPEQSLETKVTCTQCHRTFFPLAAAGSRRKRDDNSKPIIYGVVAVVALILMALLINALSSSTKRKTNTVVEIPQPTNLGNSTREVRSVMAWADAIGTKDSLNARMYTDLEAVQKLLGVEPDTKYASTFGDGRIELGNKILDALYISDQAIVYRSYRPSMGRIMHESMVAKKAGKVRLSLYPRNSKVIKSGATVEVYYRLDPSDDNFKIYRWHVVEMARTEFLLEQIDGKKPKKKHKTHELIGKITSRKITFAGEQVEVEEAELVPLPHHKDTSPEDRKTIDDLIGVVLDLNVSGILRNRATETLIEFGKASVPRLLSKMYELHKMKTPEDVMTVNLLCRTLRLTTGWRFGFNPRDHKGSNLGGTDAERVSALKQWYAWWARYYDRDDWKLEDSDEEIELTTAEQEAKRKVDLEKKKKEIEARRRRARGGK